MYPFKISVIICTYNGAAYIQQTLDSLSKQSIPFADYEVLIINNNSNDETPQLIEEYIQNNPVVNARCEVEFSPGLSFARNKGIEEAKGEYIVYIDDDAIASPTFLEGHLEIYSSHSDAMAGGGKILPQYPVGKEPLWMTPYVMGLYSLCDMGEEMIPFHKKYPVGCNMSFHLESIKNTGGFNTDINYRSDEKFVFNNLNKLKKKIYYNPKALCHHIIPEVRLSDEGIIKISKIVGIGERERLRTSIIGSTVKFIEYIAKYKIALVLGLGFILKGEAHKAKYLEIIRRFILIGFIASKKIRK